MKVARIYDQGMHVHGNAADAPRTRQVPRVRRTTDTIYNVHTAEQLLRTEV